MILNDTWNLWPFNTYKKHKFRTQFGVLSRYLFRKFSQLVKGLAFWDNWNGFPSNSQAPTPSVCQEIEWLSLWGHPLFVTCVLVSSWNERIHISMCEYDVFLPPAKKHWDILRHWSTNHKLDCILDSFVKLISVLFCNTLHWHNTVTDSKSNLYFSLVLLLSQASLICVPGKITSHLVLDTSLGEFHSDVREVQWSSLV